MQNHKNIVSTLIAVLVLVACGGGGGGGEPAVAAEPAAAGTDTTGTAPAPASAACAAAPIAATGYSLVFKGCDAANVSTYYDKTECVRDNASGLIWQGQTGAGVGLRANNQYKTNYDNITELQKFVSGGNVAPTQAEVDAITNSIGFKNAVNASNLCGSAAWRVPNKDELLSIVKTGITPTIDSDWFPNAASRRYWTSLRYPDGSYQDVAYVVNFNSGSGLSYGYRDGATGSSDILVRLVRN